jgi:5-formyltetrahydrofolate cyclo-ligase
LIISVLLVLQLQGRFLFSYMTKDQLRKEYKQRRHALTVEEKAAFEQKIFEQLKQFDWSMYNYVHVYLPMHKFNEPDTAQFIKWIRTFHPQVNLVISKSEFSTGEMQNYLLDDTTILEENKWGILEPKDGDLVAEEKIDFVLVPLIVVDINGNRVGYGKGFYDRFLAKCKANVKSYGISYFEPVESITDVGEWDVTLTGCITPNKVYTFS